MNTAQTLTLAVQRHQAGNLHEAELLYRQILQAEPRHADALHLLGLIAHQVGRNDLAADYIRQALRESPKMAAAHCNLGAVLQALGQLDEAVACFRQAVSLKPNYAEAHNNLGNVLRMQDKPAEAVVCLTRSPASRAELCGSIDEHGAGPAELGRLDDAVGYLQQAVRLMPNQVEAHLNLGAARQKQGLLTEAAACYELAVRLRPDSAEAHNHLGYVVRMQGKLDEAVACYERAVALNPRLAEAHNNLGAARSEQGRTEEAAACFERALVLEPNNADALSNLGGVLRSLGKLAEAEACCLRALSLKPDQAVAHSNLGAVRTAQGRFDEAANHYERALSLRPDYGEAHANYGNSLYMQGRLAEATEHYERALRHEPDNGDLHLNSAMPWLIQGDFAKAWEEFEWRWRRRIQPPRPFVQPLWQGEPLAGRTILLHAEQGLGDTLQMVRYVALVRAQGAGRVVLECQPRLAPLLAGSCGPDAQAGLSADQVVAQDEELPAFDMHAPLFSLPRLLGTTSLERIPDHVPYLRCDPMKVAQWRHRIEALTAGPESSPLRRLKVGINWQGNPKHKDDPRRSVRLERFAPLCRVPGLSMVSLQYGYGSEQLSEMSGVPDLGAELADLTDLAAALQSLDLVVTVDTAMAHLAGALGVRVWVALAFVPDWRWLLKRADCPWYPTMRLFRQERWGEWEGVFERIAEAASSEEMALACLIGQQRPVRLPEINDLDYDDCVRKDDAKSQETYHATIPQCCSAIDYSIVNE